MNIRAGKLKKIWRALKREEGNATIEFVILFPAVMTLFLSSFEVSVLLLRSVLLEKSLDTTVREMRLGVVDPQTQAELKRILCARAPILPECSETMKVELVVVPTSSWNLPDGRIKCVDTAASINPAVTANFGTANDLMVVRACAKVDPFFATTPWVMDLLPLDTTGQYAVVASSTFVNEP
ncbi:TadE/TadG family type IV pilus assembly protein [Maritimibacter dapengensis]|uniref:Pilus assembly protein n=1 Tax=Maritimibacter dapengensis TaxID=2836868 RepID=A0ABS6SZE4_9RHOB|nr:TadE/TadG family type IV pilus assembly protein [Maritimibacter dapengensis]MBV7378327.1 pilus assembly protein [Maritimibacter dapengensis]